MIDDERRRGGRGRKTSFTMEGGGWRGRKEKEKKKKMRKGKLWKEGRGMKKERREM